MQWDAARGVAWTDTRHVGVHMAWTDTRHVGVHMAWTDTRHVGVGPHRDRDPLIVMGFPPF